MEKDKSGLDRWDGYMLGDVNGIEMERTNNNNNAHKMLMELKWKELTTTIMHTKL